MIRLLSTPGNDPDYESGVLKALRMTTEKPPARAKRVTQNAPFATAPDVSMILVALSSVFTLVFRRLSTGPMLRLPILLVGALLSGCEVSAPAPDTGRVGTLAKTEHAPNSIVIHVDSTGLPVPTLSGFVYIDPTSVEPLRRVSARLIQLDQIYDLAVPIAQDKNGRLTADWSTLDASLELVRQSGARPVMALDFTPAVLSSRPYLENSERRSVPPASYAAWDSLVYHTVRHIKEDKRIDVAYWSVWNEPDYGMFWNVDPRRYTRWAFAARDADQWTPSPIRAAAPGAFREIARRIEYTRLYETTARAIKRADPGALVGGPNLGTFSKGWMASFLNVCRERHIPLDFVSWHYPGYEEEMRASMDWLRSWHDRKGLTTPPALITEWYAKVSEGTDKWTEALETLEIARGYTVAGVTAALYYTVGRITSQETSENTPIGIAFQALGKLIGKQTRCETPEGVNAIAAQDADGRVNLTLWTAHPFLEPVRLQFPAGLFRSCELAVNYETKTPFLESRSLEGDTRVTVDIPASERLIGSVTLIP